MAEERISFLKSIEGEAPMSSQAQRAALVATLFKTLSEDESDFRQRFQANRKNLTEDDMIYALEIIRHLGGENQRSYNDLQEEAKQFLQAVKNN